MKASLIVVCVAMLAAGTGLLAQQHKTHPTASNSAVSSQEALMKAAMTAAPASIVRGATLVTMTPDGGMRTVREGTNGWTCMGEPDPACADHNAMAWLEAYAKKADPPNGKVGFVYMLAGDHGTSNTDPFATTATPTNNWVKTGPHVMVVGAKGMTDGYPNGAKADPTKPYVMWAGTLYEHLMLPTK